MFLDLTEETVCRQLTLLKRQEVIGLISSREVAVPDLRLLGALAGASGSAALERCPKPAPESGLVHAAAASALQWQSAS